MWRCRPTARWSWSTIQAGAILAIAACATAQEILIDEGGTFEPTSGAIPFAFYNDNLDFGLGGAYVTNGVYQQQLTTIAGGFGTTNASWTLFSFGPARNAWGGVADIIVGNVDNYDPARTRCSYDPSNGTISQGWIIRSNKGGFTVPSE